MAHKPQGLFKKAEEMAGYCVICCVSGMSTTQSGSDVEIPGASDNECRSAKIWGSDAKRSWSSIVFHPNSDLR